MDEPEHIRTILPRLFDSLDYALAYNYLRAAVDEISRQMREGWAPGANVPAWAFRLEDALEQAAWRLTIGKESK